MKLNKRKFESLSKDEKEDLGIFLLMEQDEKNGTVSKVEIMKALNEDHNPNKETIKAIEEAQNNKNLTPINDLDNFSQNL